MSPRSCAWTALQRCSSRVVRPLVDRLPRPIPARRQRGNWATGGGHFCERFGVARFAGATSPTSISSALTLGIDVTERQRGGDIAVWGCLEGVALGGLMRSWSEKNQLFGEQLVATVRRLPPVPVPVSVPVHLQPRAHLCADRPGGFRGCSSDALAAGSEPGSCVHSPGRPRQSSSSLTRA